MATPRKTVSALADEIVALVRAGKIPPRFRVFDFRPLVHGFSEKHIMTVLPNYEKNGDQVRRGRQARFLRVDRGLYQLI